MDTNLNNIVESQLFTIPMKITTSATVLQNNNKAGDEV